VWAVPLALCDAARAADVPLRLRIAWGGGAEHAERQWRGTVRLDKGQFVELAPLGIEADEPGSMWIDGGVAHIEERSLRAYDAFDAVANAPFDAVCTVMLEAIGTPGLSKTVEVPLTQLTIGAHTSALDEAGNRLFVTRSPGDLLHVSFARPALVFEPAESFAFEVEPRLMGIVQKDRVRLRAQLLGAAGERIWSGEQESALAGAVHAPARFEIKLPEAEGVYTISIAAVTNGIGQRLALRWNRPLAERNVQLVVVGSQAPAQETQPAPLTTRVVEIDPANPRWRERLANVALPPQVRKAPLGSGDAARWDHPKFGQLVQLAPPREADPSWEAYPLPIAALGEPHVLEVEYPSDVPQTLGISLLETNAAGALAPIQLDSGVYVSDEEAEESPKLLKHRLVFWPRTKTPTLLLTNRRPGASAVYGKLRVLSAPHRTFGALPLSRSAPTLSRLPRAFPKQEKSERLLAGYFDRPLLTENFSAHEALDPATHSSLDDWSTFYQGGSRLVEYLNYVGWNGLMVSVMADGSTLYPSKLLEPTPRYDTGVFFASGQDPVRKDVLEMLFRMFDREEMQLIPALHFATPLPELEALKRTGIPVTGGLEPIGADGTRWLDKNAPKEGLAPYYNPLDERVQKAMLSVAREVVGRYASHRSFGGVALQLSAQGYAQLVAGDWGYDDETIRRFERDTRTRVPGQGSGRFAARAKALSSATLDEHAPGLELRRAWLVWRAEKLAGFHTRLAREITAAHRGAKLYLAGATMLDSAYVQRQLRPALPRQAKVEDVLLTLGINTRAYEGTPDIVLLRPQRIGPIQSLAAQPGNLEMNLAPEVDALYGASASKGVLFYHQPQKTHLPSFDKKRPFGSVHTLTWLVSQLSPSADRNRRRFVHALSAMDVDTIFDGGWLLPLGQEESLTDLVHVYRQLPRGRFETISRQNQPVTIRRCVTKGETFVYLVNDSAWHATVSMQVQIPRGCEMTLLGLADDKSLSTVRGGSWSVRLKPFDLVAARFSAPGVQVRAPQVKLAENVQLALDRRIQDLGERARALSDPAPLTVLENPSFELPPQEDGVPGWSSTAGNEKLLIDRAVNQKGSQSLKLTSTGERLTVTSAPLKPPKTGRLLLSVAMRVADSRAQPAVRLAVAAKHENGSFYRFGLVGGSRPAGSPLGTQWARYDFPVDDVPTEGVSDLRVQFELLGAGDVWIDDVELFDLSFKPNERLELTKIITLAYSNLQEGRVSDCIRLLDGYWPQFLVANVPLTQSPVSIAARTEAPPHNSPEPAEPAKPGALERMRGLVPKFLRF